MTASPHIPEPLREVLSAARRELKTLGIDRTSARRVLVEVGHKEIEAVYQMSGDIREAKRSRDEWHRRATSRGRTASDNAAPPEPPHMLALLVDVERLLCGEEESPRALHDALARVREEIAKRRRRRR